MLLKSNSESSLIEKDSDSYLYEAIEELFNFKKSLKQKKNDKIYIITNNITECFKEELGIDFYKEINKTKIEKKLEDNIVKEKIDKEIDNIKVFNQSEEIEDENIEIVNELFLQHLRVNEKKYKDKEIDLRIINDKKYQVLFKDSGTRLNILIRKNNKKLLHFIEGPTINKNNENNEDIKNHENHDFNNNKSLKIEHSVHHSILGNNSINGNGNLIDNDNISQNNELIINFNHNSLNMNLKNFLRDIKEIYIKQISINALLKEPINLEKEYNNYLIVNKKWFNKLSKIFEDDNIYENEDEMITTFRNISKNTDKIEKQIFIKRKKLLEEEDLLDLEFEKRLKIKYPKDFILIEENILKKFNLDFNYDINKNKYTMVFGDNYLFIKDKEDNKNIFACSKDNFFFSVNIIFKYYDEEYFNQDINKYVYNRGGLKYYLESGNYKEDNSPQNITNSEGDFFGQILILKDIRKKETHWNSFNSCLCSLILSLVNIEKFNDAIINLEQTDNNRIISLLLDFLNSYNDDLIKEIQNDIYKEKKDNSNRNEFENIIDYILTELHKDLINIKSFEPILDYDEKQAFKRFEEKYLKNNYFKTKNKFIGIKEIIRYNDCCSLKRYSFEIFKYIFINSKILQKNNNLNDCVKEWENQVNNEEKKCDMCLIENNSSVTTKIYENPEILIIILDNIESEFEIKIGVQLNINKCKYNLINCITNKDNNNLIYKNQKWFILDKNLNFLREVDNEEIEIESLLKYPKVLFYEKDGDENEVKDNNLFESGCITDVFYDNDYSIDGILNQNNDKNNINKNINENENIINFNNNKDLNNNPLNDPNFLNCVNMNNVNSMNNMYNMNYMNNMNNMNNMYNMNNMNNMNYMNNMNNMNNMNYMNNMNMNNINNMNMNNMNNMNMNNMNNINNMNNMNYPNNNINVPNNNMNNFTNIMQ